MGLKAVATLVAGGGPPVGGSGTIGKIPKWATTTTLGDSVITESGGNVGIGTTSPGRLLTASVSNAGGTINTGTAVVRVVNASHASADNRFCGVHFAHTDADAQVTGAIGTVLTSTAVAWAGDMVFGVKSSATASVLTEYMRIQAGGNVGIGTASPTAALHLKAGEAAANTAPLKLTSGTNLTTAEEGAFEYDGTNLYFTTSTGRKTVTLV